MLENNLPLVFIILIRLCIILCDIRNFFPVVLLFCCKLLFLFAPVSSCCCSSEDLVHVDRILGLHIRDFGMHGSRNGRSIDLGLTPFAKTLISLVSNQI